MTHHYVLDVYWFNGREINSYALLKLDPGCILNDTLDIRFF